MGSDRIFGLSAALVTPFGDDGSVDAARLVSHARKVLAEGCDSFTLFGTTGEGYGLSMKEREAILAAVAGTGLDMGDKVYAGVSAVSIDDAVSQSKLAFDAGVRGLLLAPPLVLPSCRATTTPLRAAVIGEPVFILKSSPKRPRCENCEL